THREDVAHDAADTGRCALVGLDEGRVIVAFHLEDDRLAVANIDDAGVLTRSLDHPRRRRRQLAQMDTRGLVGAVLAPHDGEDAELGQVRRAIHDAQNVTPLVFGKAVFDGLRQCRFAHERALTKLSKIALPSVPPISGSAWRSGWGIS